MVSKDIPTLRENCAIIREVDPVSYLGGGLVLLDQLDTDNGRATIDINDIVGSTVDEIAVLITPQLSFQKGTIRLLERALLLHGNVSADIGGLSDPASLEIHDQAGGSGLDEEPVVLLDGDNLGAGSGGLGHGAGDNALNLEPLEGGDLEGPLLILVVVDLGALEGEAGTVLGTIALNVDGVKRLALDDEGAVGRLPALVVGLLALLGDALHQSGAVTDDSLLAVKDELRSPVDDLAILVSPELRLDLSLVLFCDGGDLSVHADKDVRGQRISILLNIDNETG